MTRRTLLLAFSGALLATGCLEARERLDTPRVSVELDDDSVTKGSDVTGVIYAADASGVAYVAAELFFEGDTVPRRRMRDNAVHDDSIAFPFFLTVDADTPSGVRLLIRGVAIDNQLFTVTTEDTAYVR